MYRIRIHQLTTIQHADHPLDRDLAVITDGDGGTRKFHAHPPAWLVQGVESLGYWPGIRPLEAVVTAPVLLPDGRVLQRPGYDPDSGLLYQPDADYLPVPEKPTLL